MNKQTIAVFVSILLVGFFSPFGASAQAAEPAFDLINQVQGDLTQANTLLNELERAGLKTSTNSELEVSVTEIRNKITLAQDFLNQAITAYQNGNYNDALIAAKFAKSNSELSIYYISSLLNRPSRFNISNLFLQGDLLDLLGLRREFTLNLISNRLATLLENPSSEIDQQTSEGTDGNTNSDISNPNNTDPDTTENPNGELPTDNQPIDTELDNNDQTEIDIITPPPIEQPPTDLLETCLSDNKLICENNLKTCLASKKAPVSTCKVDSAKQQSKCDDWTKKADTRLAPCETKRVDCLDKAKNPKASLACTNNFNKCVVNAQKQASRDNRLADSCQVRVDQSIAKCEAKYTEKKVKFEQGVYGCFDKQNACSVKAETTCRR